MGLRLLTLEARLAWSEGRTADGLAAINAIGRSTDGLLKTPIVMTSTIGSAATRWAVLSTTDFVGDPCTSVSTLEKLREILPTEDPIHRSSVTLAVAIAEIADEGLRYIDDDHDPSMGWSIPFWVSNHYLFEDLFVAGILDRWGRHLEFGRLPAARWSPDAATSIWDDSSWPPWLALAGTVTPNLLGATARAQAATAQLQQVELAIDTRIAALQGLGSRRVRILLRINPEPPDRRADRMPVGREDRTHRGRDSGCSRSLGKACVGEKAGFAASADQAFRSLAPQGRPAAARSAVGCDAG